MLGFREELLETFRREKQAGLEALSRDDKPRARTCFISAADALYRLAQHSEGPLRTRRADSARKLLETARAIPTERHGSGTRREREGDAGGLDFLVRDKPKVRFDDIAGLDDVKERFLLRLVYPFKHPEKARKFEVPLGGGILLFGPPGTGKTLLAQAVAGEIDAAFFTVKPSDILSKWVGEAERNVDSLFDAARSQPVSVIFIDELDALAPSRSENQNSVMSRLVPQILAELEGFASNESNALLFLGATNEPWSLDTAMLRPGRFDEKIHVGLPERAARRRILELQLGEKPIASDVDLDELSSLLQGFTGADIRGICQTAASEAFLEEIRTGRETHLDRGLLVRHIRRAVPSVSSEMARRYAEYARAYSGGSRRDSVEAPAEPTETGRTTS